MGIALFWLYFVVVGFFQSIFLLMVIFKKREGTFIHSTLTRIIGCILAAFTFVALFVTFAIFI